MPRVVIAHGHIFKNAGTTLDWALQRCFGSGFLDHRDDAPMRQQGAPYLGRFLADHPHIVALSSHHLCQPLPQLEDTLLFPLYLIRDPYDRVFSVYEFERRQQADTPGAIHAKKMDLAEYLAWRLLPTVRPVLRNYQTRYLAGAHDPWKIEVDEPLYQQALVTLRTATVGTVERFDHSMLLFESRLQPWFPQLNLAYELQNRGQRIRPGAGQSAELLRQQVGEDLFYRFQSANRYDLGLHQAAGAELSDGLGQGERRLDEFRARCRHLQSGSQAV